MALAHPDVPSYTSNLASCYMRIGILHSDRKFLDQALAALEQAKNIQERLIARLPGRPADERMLAEILVVMGNVFHERKDNPAALRSYQRGRAHLSVAARRRRRRPQTDSNPRPARHQLLQQRGHLDRHGPARRGAKIFRAVTRIPNNPDGSASVGEDLSGTTGQKPGGDRPPSVHDSENDEDALTSIKKSIEILEKLVKSQPDEAGYRHDLGRSWNIQGYFHDEARDNKAAILDFERAIAEEKRAVAAAREVDLYQDELATQVDNLGEQYVDLGRVNDALPYYRDEIAILRKLVEARPTHHEFAHKLAEALSKLGSIQRHAGDSVAAAQTFHDALAVLERIGEPEIPNQQGPLRAILTQQAVALADQGKTPEAIPLLERAVDTLSHHGKAATTPADERAREQLGDTLWELARLVRSTGDTSKATEIDVRRKALWQDQPPAKLAILASTERNWRSRSATGRRRFWTPPGRCRSLDLDQAAADLKLAIALGFSDLSMLRKHRDSWALLALCERDDVKRLIQDLERPRADAPGQPQKEP